MVIDTVLRPWLVEFGASVPTRGVCFELPRMGEREALVDQSAQETLVTLSGEVRPVRRPVRA
jgi:hypothetical protein